MARFRFTLARLLDRRLKEEEARRLVLVKLEGHRRALEDSLRDRQREISAGRDEWRRQLVGEIDPAALRHQAGASLGLLRKAQRTVLEIAGMEKGLARAKQDLVEAAQARRALEILREQRLAAFRAVEARRERDQLDEFAQEMDRRARLEREQNEGRGAA
jgi:flagellar export protein FliJ